MTGETRVCLSPGDVPGTRACGGGQTRHRNPGTRHAPVRGLPTPTAYTTCPRAGLEGAQTAQDGPEGAGGLADPGRGVAGAALRGRPLPFPEGQVREPQQCWPLLLGSWELHDLC